MFDETDKGKYEDISITYGDRMSGDENSICWDKTPL